MARRSLTTCSRTSSSATCEGPSRGPTATARGCSSRRGGGAILTPYDFPPGLILEPSPAASGDDLRAAVRDYERQHIQRVLSESGDDKREAARRLGLGLSSLYRKLEELGLRAAL